VEVTVAFFADLANSDAAGKVNAIGIFNQVVSDQYPVKFDEIAFVLMLDLEGADLSVNHQLKLTYSLDGGEEELMADEVPMNLPAISDGSPSTVAQMVARMGGLTIPSAGRYVYNVFIDGQLKAQTGFRALVRGKRTDNGNTATVL
jgi:hypothetical protein